MKNFTFNDSGGNHIKKTKRWLGLLAFCMMLFVGQRGYSQYCTPTSTYTSDYISHFNTSTATLNITHNLAGIPGGNGYEDFTDMVIAHYPGGSFDFSTTYIGGSNRIKIWVDWNNDAVFSETELLINIQDGNATKNGVINIPEGTALGDYRFRLRSRFSTSDPGPCEDITFGDTRDYT